MRAPNGVRVDILPASEADLRRGVIEWPRSGFRMSLIGFRQAFEFAAIVRVAPDLELRVASVPVIVLLKIAAYQDRPAARRKDLGDLSHILTRWPPHDDPRRYATDVSAVTGDYEEAGALVLGRDVGAMVDERDRRIVEEFLANHEHATREHMTRLGPSSWVESPEVLQNLRGVVRARVSRGLAKVPGIRVAKPVAPYLRPPPTTPCNTATPKSRSPPAPSPRARRSRHSESATPACARSSSRRSRP